MNKDELKTSKAYQALNQEEPIGSPPELDAAILAQAHKAVQAKPKAVTARSHLTLRWGAPIASAALVVLSVTVFIVMPELEQQQAMQSYEQNFEADAYSESVEQALEAKEYSAKQERKTSQRSVAKAMKKVAPEVQRVQMSPEPLAPLASGMSVDSFSGAEDLAMDSLEEKLLSDAVAEVPMASVAAAPVELEAVLAANKWIDKIQQLIEQKDWLNADKQYAKFAKHYPEHEFNKEYVKLKQN